MTNDAGETVRVKVAVCERAGLLESVTLKVRAVPATDVEVVPLIAPVEAFMVKPAGRDPLFNYHMYGDLPPVAVSVAL
jgi:hypothetical protein